MWVLVKVLFATLLSVTQRKYELDTSKDSEYRSFRLPGARDNAVGDGVENVLYE
jgi:hypothetical protein